MFGLFKKKMSLQDLIPGGYFDIHNHLLPGIDDGSPSLQDTEILVSRLSEIGFGGCLSTPHTLSGLWDNTPETISNSFASLKDSPLAKDFIRGYSSEYMIDYEFYQGIKTKNLLPLYDRYILVEMSCREAPYFLLEAIFQLSVKGYKIILAHPERYTFYHHSFKEYEELKNRGVYFQMNLLSSVGYYGENVHKTADRLLQAGMIDFTGSDTHHLRHLEAYEKPIKIKQIDAFQRALEANEEFRR